MFEDESGGKHTNVSLICKARERKAIDKAKREAFTKQRVVTLDYFRVAPDAPGSLFFCLVLFASIVYIRIVRKTKKNVRWV